MNIGTSFESHKQKKWSLKRGCLTEDFNVFANRKLNRHVNQPIRLNITPKADGPPICTSILTACLESSVRHPPFEVNFYGLSKEVLHSTHCTGGKLGMH